MCIAMTGYLLASSVMSAKMFSLANERVGGARGISSCDWRGSSGGRSGWRSFTGVVHWGPLTATSYSTKNWAWGTCTVLSVRNLYRNVSWRFQWSQRLVEWVPNPNFLVSLSLNYSVSDQRIFKEKSRVSFNQRLTRCLAFEHLLSLVKHWVVKQLCFVITFPDWKAESGNVLQLLRHWGVRIIDSADWGFDYNLNNLLSSVSEPEVSLRLPLEGRPLVLSNNLLLDCLFAVKAGLTSFSLLFLRRFRWLKSSSKSAMSSSQSPRIRSSSESRNFKEKYYVTQLR